jgi:hypothetical protein
VVLASHEVFNAVERIDEHRFIADSDLSAAQLSEYIVQQHWGLTRFVPHQTSLEQIFIELTAKDATMENPGMSKHS